VVLITEKGRIINSIKQNRKMRGIFKKMRRKEEERKGRK
jgi:hypothetical protein